MYFNFLRNQKGVSLIEIMIGSVMLGVAVLGYMKLTAVNQSQSNTQVESIQLMKIRNIIQENFTKTIQDEFDNSVKEVCLKLLGSFGWNELSSSDSSFNQSRALENDLLELILPSTGKDFFLKNLVIKASAPFNLSSLDPKETHDLRTDVTVIIQRKDNVSKKDNFRRDEIIIAPESNPLSLLMSIGKDGYVKSCYLRNSRDMAMASYVCNEMGGVLKAGKCLFPMFQGVPTQPSTFYSMNRKMSDPSVKFVTLQEMICRLEKSVVAVESNGITGIRYPDNTGPFLELAKGRPAVNAITKFCPIPQGAQAGGANAFFLNDI